MSKIQSLISEGVIVEYRDFRSGTFSDFSGNNNVATPTDVHLMKGGGARFVNPAAAGTNLISIPNTASYDFGTGTDFSIYVWFKTIVNTSARNMRLLSNTNITGGFFADMNNNIPRLFFEGGANYNLIFNAAINPTLGAHVCWVIDRDVSGYTYYNGSLVASTEANPGDRQENLDTTNPLQLGKVIAQTNDMFDGVWNACLIANRVLTASEVNQIQGELEGMKWPSKTSGRTANKLTPNANDSSLVVGYDMKKINGTVQDFSQNSIPGTVNGNPLNATTNMGSTLRLNGVDADIEATNALLNVSGTTELTLACWVKTNITTGTHYCIVNGINTYAYTLSIASNGRARIVIDQDWGGDMDIYGTSALLRDGQWHYLVASLTTSGANSTLSLYVDGVLDNSNTFAAYTITGVNTGLYVGRSQSTYSDSTFASAEVYNEGKNASWVATQYAKGAGVVQYKTDWGAHVSTANISSGEIENTGWYVTAGNWQINTDTIGGEDVKVFSCMTDNSRIYATMNSFGMTEKEGVYGTWDFWWYQYDGNNVILIDLNTEPDGSGNGYQFRFGAAERFRLRQLNAGTPSDYMYTNTSYFNTGQWYHMKITRSPVGVWTVYRDGVLVDVTGGAGTNPVTENTYTSAKYMTILARATDMIAFSDKKGDHSFIKKLGVD